MQILFAEDTEIFHKTYGKMLEKFGEVKIVDTANAARRELLDDDVRYDIIFCDHYVPNTKGGIVGENGLNLYKDILRKDIRRGHPLLFVHFSSMPCPMDYRKIPKEKDEWFYSLGKGCDFEGIQKVFNRHKELTKRRP